LGRQALGAALRTLGQGDLGILLPEFICRDVPETCRKMGFTVRWYEVDRQLRPLGLSKQPACRAILAVHYFGFPQDLKPFQAYCRRTGAHFIEDAAHAFLSKTPQGKPLGSAGDFGIFSFRKTLPLPDGAALRAGSVWRGATRRATRCLAGKPASRRLEFVKKNILQRWPRAGFELRRLLRPLRTFCERLIPTPEFQPPFPGLGKALQALKPLKEIQRRQKAWKEFHRLALQAGVSPLRGGLPPGACPYGYAFRSHHPPDAMRRAAAAAGFSLIRWPDLPGEIRGPIPHFYQNVYFINFLESCPS